MTINAAQALGHLPQGLRDELTAEFAKISDNYRERRWEAAELDGGRLCEIVYTILDGYTSGGAYAAHARKPPAFEAACRNLANRTAYPTSARLTIPRVLVALYEIRNRRGVSHVGGEVASNHMDAEFVIAAARWLLAELIRMFHSTDVQTATDVVDALVERTLPVIWQVDGAKRVLNRGLTLTSQTLLLLYSDPSPVSDKDLAKHLEQARPANYRRVLDRLHQTRQVEWNRHTGTVTLSPLGIKEVEDHLLK